MVCKNLRALFIILMLSVVTVFAATTGKIRGKVVDASTGEPIPGATVMVEGTQLGASTMANGEYFILQVPPGLHRVKCLIVGYTTLTQENIIISSDTTTTVDFKMSTKIAGQEDIVVQAKKPIVQKDNTSSQKTFDNQQISKLVNPTMTGVLEQQAGVVKGASGELHVRGGRSDEVAYIIDGVMVNSSLIGGTSFNLQSEAIEEMKVVTGGFNAEYGGVMSSIVRVVTKSGQKHYSGSASYKTSRYIFTEWEKFGIDQYKAFVSGPIPNPFIKDMSFSLSAAFDDDNSYLRHNSKSNFLIDKISADELAYFTRIGQIEDTLDPEYNSTAYWLYNSGFEPYSKGYRPEGFNRSWKYYANISMRPVKTLKVTMTGNVQVGHEYENYSESRRYRFFQSTDDFVRNDFFTLSATHTLSSNMYYEASFSTQYDARLETNGGRHFSSFNGYDTDNVYSSNVNLGYLSIKSGEYSYRIVTGFEPYFYNFRDDAMKGNIALTYQADRINQLKMGVGFQKTKLVYEYYDSRESELAGQDFYEVEPYSINAFVQDKIEVEDMIINIGARMEYYNPNVDYFVSPGEAVKHHITTSPKGNIFKGEFVGEKKTAEGKMYIMPRLGLSYPLSDTGVFRFSFGHFYQYPTYRYVFAHIQRPINGDYLGNPELEAQKSVQYEVGFDQGLSDILSISVTGYYKETSDILSLEKTFDSGKTFYKYSNKDFGRIMGMDFTLSKFFTNNMSFDISYGFSMAKGSASTPNENAVDMSIDDDYVDPVKTTYLNYDRRHTLSANLAIKFFKGEGFEIYGVKPIENTELSIAFTMESGLPYTRSNITGDPISEKNEARMPSSKNVDLKFARGFNVYKTVSAKFIIEASNLFNWSNVNGVNTYTGKYSADSIDSDDFNMNDKIDKYQYWMTKESNTLLGQYSNPRIVKFGVEVSF